MSDAFANVRDAMDNVEGQVDAVCFAAMQSDGPELILDPGPRNEHTMDAHMILAMAHLDALANHFDTDIQGVAEDVVDVRRQLEAQGAVSFFTDNAGDPRE